MPPRRSKPLPPGLYQRGNIIWCWFYGPNGERVRERAGVSVDEARRHLAERKRQVATGTYGSPGGTGEQNIGTYAEVWIALRERDGVRSVDREKQIIRDHIAPRLGSVRLSELRPRNVADWVRALSFEMSPKSVRNVHGVLSAMLARARFDELVFDNPAKGLPRGILPKNVRVRDVSAWTRDECESLMSHPEIIEAHRMAYAIASFTGARVGEVAGLRWRDLDTKAAPLWRWALRTQYDGAPLKTDNPRDIPIHAELQRMLERWKVDGWACWVLRHPRPEDFVIPRVDGNVHSKQSLGSKAVHRHAKLAGIDSTGRDFHSFRRAMITLCRTDGARTDVLERITHNASGQMIDGYTYFGWSLLCEAVSCLRLTPAKYAPAVALPVTVAVTVERLAGGIGGKIAAIRMEAPGVEPGSESDLR